MSLAIDQAFVSSFIGGGFAIDVAYENGGYSSWDGAAYTYSGNAYVPTVGREYAELSQSDGGRTVFSIDKSDDNVGLFQVALYYPAGTGAITAKTKAEAVMSLYSVGAQISYSGQVVHILSCDRGTGIVEGDFYRINVRCNYRAFTTR